MLGDKERLAKLVKRYEMFFTPNGRSYVPPPNNVDNSVFGILPMEIYRQNGAKAADKRGWTWGKIRRTSNGSNWDPMD